jgi:nucleoside-diphosphate-sugar epimerase
MTTLRMQNFEKKNIIVTGGAGFIGSHLCDALVTNHKVICIDNFSTGREENIHHLLSNPNFEFIRHDLTVAMDLNILRELKAFQVPFQGIQEIYHLASPSSPKDYTKLTVETLLANADGTKNALEIAQGYNAKFLLLSSGSIYGQPTEKTPFPENYFGYVDPVGIRSPYQEGKRYAEALVAAFRKRHSLDAKIIRLFNCYGPRMRLSDGRMIPEFIQAAIESRPIIVNGSKNDTATFCYITDVLEGIIRMMASKELGPINIGNPEEHTLGEVAQLVINLAGGRQEIREEPPTAFSQRQPTPSIRMARENLGWFPVVKLNEGLQRTVDYLSGTRTVGMESIHFTDTA